MTRTRTLMTASTGRSLTPAITLPTSTSESLPKRKAVGAVMVARVSVAEVEAPAAVKAAAKAVANNKRLAA